MFKRYMIVLAVLAVISTALGAYLGDISTQHGDEYMEISKYCEHLTYDSSKWDERCSMNYYSDKSMAFNATIVTERRATKLLSYTGGILLLMLVSGVLRWIWKGRNI